MIPKIIWQTHEWEYKDLPNHFLKIIKTWENLNPGWNHRYVSGAQRALYIEQYDQILYRYYLLADKITQADIWRYVVVYRDGGVYADMDSICTMPLDYMIDKYYNEEDVISVAIMTDKYEERARWRAKDNPEFSSGGVNNSNFAAIKNSKIMKLILDNIIKKYKTITLFDLFIRSEIGNSINPIAGKTHCFFLGYSAYSDVVMKNQDSVCFNFEASMHSNVLKEKFDTDYMINYYGKEIPYFSFVKEKNLNLF